MVPPLVFPLFPENSISLIEIAHIAGDPKWSKAKLTSNVNKPEYSINLVIKVIEKLGLSVITA